MMAALAAEQLAAMEREGSTAGVNADGFYVKKMNVREWMQAIGDLGLSVWETAALPESYWNKDDTAYAHAPIHAPGVFAGVSDGVVNMVTEFPQLIKLGYDVATKEEVRRGIWNSIKSIELSSIISMIKAEVKGKMADYNFDDKPWEGYHTLGKDAVVVASFFGGGFITSGAKKTLAEGMEGTGEQIQKAIKKKLDNIEVEMLTDAFKKKLDDAFSRYKGKLSRLDWEEKYKTLYKNKAKGAISEAKFLELMGGDPISIDVGSLGRRDVDNFLNGTAREVKSGLLKADEFTKKQIQKDIKLLQDYLGEVKKIEWHLFGGADPKIIEILENAKNVLGSNKFDYFVY